MSLAYEPPPSAGDGPRVVPFAEYQRERAGRIEAQEKLSAVAAIIQDPQLQHSEARTRAAVVLALEAQRPADNPTRPFRLDLGTLAKHAGLVPPTPEGDEKKRAAAYKAGRKVAGQVVKDLAGGGGRNR